MKGKYVDTSRGELCVTVLYQSLKGSTPESACYMVKWQVLVHRGGNVRSGDTQQVPLAVLGDTDGVLGDRGAELTWQIFHSA